MPVTERVEYIIGLRDKITRKLKGITKATSTADKAMMGLGRRFLGMAAVAGVARGFSKAVGKMAEFEQVASNLSAITGAAGEDLDFLKQKAIELGGASTKSSVEALEAFKLIASAKPELLDNAAALAETTKQAIALSEASGLTLPDAAKALSAALNQFELQANQSSRVINVLAAGSKFASAEIPDLTTSLEEFGGIAKSLNITLEESAAAVEAVSGKLKGSRAGIQMRNVLLKLGTSLDNNINPSVVGLSTALENLAPIQDDVNALEKLFGRQNVIVGQTLIKNRKRFDELTEAMTGTNIAYEQQRVNTDNLRSDVQGMNSAWERFILNLNEGGGRITKVFRKATQDATMFANALNRMALGREEVAKRFRLGEVEKSMELTRQFRQDIGITTPDEFKIELHNQFKAIQEAVRKQQSKVARLGGEEKGKKIREGGLLRGLTQRGKDLAAATSLLEQFRLEADQLRELLTNPEKLDVFMKSVLPAIEAEPIEAEPVEFAKEAKKQVTTITGAAPKTFNIHIEKLIETQEINTQNLEESASAVKLAITRAMGEALADVEPITI